MLYFIAQCFGFVGTGVLFISYQMPVKKNILLLQVFSMSIFAFHFFVLGLSTGNFTGMVMNLVAALRTLLFYYEDKGWFQRRIFTACCLAAVLFLGVYTYVNIFSLFPILGMIVSTLCLNIKKEKWFRIFNFPGSPLWLTYNIYSKSYSGIIGEVMTMSSIAIAIFRYDIKKSAKKDNAALQSEKTCA